MSEGNHSGKSYVFVWLALLVLTAISYAVSLVHLGPLGVPIALTIATVKALLVAYIFMHLNESSFAIRSILIVSVLFIAIMIALMLADTEMRKTMPMRPEKPFLKVETVVENKTPAPAAAEPAKATP